MPTYRGTDIPQEIWDFFNTEKGLSTKQLTRAIDKRLAINPYYDFDFSYRMICKFSGGYDLVRYYRDNSKLSVDELLQYNAYAIRDFIVGDEGFKFHNWLLKHHLTMPSKLVGDMWDKITDLCKESGVEYLNRKITTSPESQWQIKLNELVTMKSSDLARDVEAVLKDVLASPHEVKWDTVEQRFIAFKAKELQREISLANKFTGNGVHSLFWLAAKKVAKFPLETNILPLEMQKVVAEAKTLKFL